VGVLWGLAFRCGVWVTKGQRLWVGGMRFPKNSEKKGQRSMKFSGGGETRWAGDHGNRGDHGSGKRRKWGGAAGKGV